MEHFSMNNSRILHVCPGSPNTWQSRMYLLILCRLVSVCGECISSKKHQVSYMSCMAVCSYAVVTAQSEHVGHHHLVPECLEVPSDFLHIWSIHSASPWDSCLYGFLQLADASQGSTGFLHVYCIMYVDIFLLFMPCHWAKFYTIPLRMLNNLQFERQSLKGR